MKRHGKTGKNTAIRMDREVSVLLLRVEFVHRQMLLVLVPMVLYPSCCGSCTVYVTSIATNDVKERVVYMSDAGRRISLYRSNLLLGARFLCHALHVHACIVRVYLCITLTILIVLVSHFGEHRSQVHIELNKQIIHSHSI